MHSDRTDEDDVEPGTYQRYALTSHADGRISGSTETNDPEDRGYPTGHDRWDVSYKSLSDMRRLTGMSHCGMNGCAVEVYLDGQKV